MAARSILLHIIGLGASVVCRRMRLVRCPHINALQLSLTTCYLPIPQNNPKPFIIHSTPLSDSDRHRRRKNYIPKANYFTIMYSLKCRRYHIKKEGRRRRAKLGDFYYTDQLACAQVHWVKPFLDLLRLQRGFLQI